MSLEQPPQFATMNEVVMTKEELLSRLVDNKAKHDIVLAAAIAGYWDTAKTQVESRKTKLFKSVEEYKSDVEREIDKILKKIEEKSELPAALNISFLDINTSLGLSYPQDHSEDYNRVIAMMQSSVYDKVKLTTVEYSQYVLNNWTWKKEFINGSSTYVDLTRTKSLKMITGCLVSYASGYGNNLNTAYNNLMLSGSAAIF